MINYDPTRRFTIDEQARMYKFSVAYSHIDDGMLLPSVAVMCSGINDVFLDATHFQNQSIIVFGSDPIQLCGNGADLEDALTRWIPEYYSREPDAVLTRILSAMNTETKFLGDKASRKESDGLTIHHRLLLAAEEARLGIYKGERE